MKPNREIVRFITDQNKSHQVVIWSKSFCHESKQSKLLFQSEFPELTVKIHDLNLRFDGGAIEQELIRLYSKEAIPFIFVNDELVGGIAELRAAHESGKLQKLVQLNPAAAAPSEHHEKENKEQNTSIGGEHASSLKLLRSMIQHENRAHRLVVWGKSSEHDSKSAKKLLQTKRAFLEGVNATFHDVESMPDGEMVEEELFRMTGEHAWPLAFVNGLYLGGKHELKSAIVQHNNEDENDNGSNESSSSHSATFRNLLRAMIEHQNNAHKVVVWGSSTDYETKAARRLLQSEGVSSAFHDLDALPDKEWVQEELLELSGERTLPSIFVDGLNLGGGTNELKTALRSGGGLKQLLAHNSTRQIAQGV